MSRFTHVNLGDAERIVIEELRDKSGSFQLSPKQTRVRAAAMPHNQTYILRNTEPGWAQLAWFEARDPREISHVFLERL